MLRMDLKVSCIRDTSTEWQRNTSNYGKRKDLLDKFLARESQCGYIISNKLVFKAN